MDWLTDHSRERPMQNSSSNLSTDLRSYCENVARRARTASRQLVGVSSERKNQWLTDSATALRQAKAQLIHANQEDLAAASGYRLSDAQTDRLRLDACRIDDISAGLERLAALNDPVGELLEQKMRPNGLEIRKVRVPLGVVFFVYESRPNVTADAAGICVKSGNAVILRGGKEAANSSSAMIAIMRGVAEQIGLPPDAVQLVSESDRAAVGHFLQLSDLIDLAIPRGGEGLIRRVAAEATMPVIKHFSGNCHVYVHRSANLQMAEDIVLNAKCHRMGVCNAAESMLVDEAISGEFLPTMVSSLLERKIEVRVDKSAAQIVAGEGIVPINESDYAAEYLGPVLSICVVPNCEAAIEHINAYGSGHTDSIVAMDTTVIDKFLLGVDSAAVIVNASTRFNDGGEFGLGAEIGISTDKFHARGPCGLNELTTYKYHVLGSGQVRM